MTHEGRLVSSLECEGSVPILRLVGTLDVNTSVQLRKDLEGALVDGCKHLLLDFSQVIFMDSSGLGALIRILRGLNEEGGRELWAAHCNHQVQSLLEATHLDRQIRTFRTIDLALAAWENESSQES